MTLRPTRLSAGDKAVLHQMQELYAARRFTTLEVFAQELVSGKPGFGKAWHFLGISRLLRNDHHGAVAPLERAVALMPGDAEAWDHLGTAQAYTRGTCEARESFRRCLALAPDRPATLANLARIENALGDHHEAERLSRRALAVRPAFRQAALHLAVALAEQSRSEEALAVVANLLAADASDLDALQVRAKVFTSLGRFDEATDAYEACLARHPEALDVRSSYLFSLSNDARCSPASVAEAHRKYGAMLEKPFRAAWGGWDNDRAPDRPLRVGFVSGDLRHHVVASFLESLLPHLGGERLVPIAYYTHARRDEVTERLAPLFREWRDVAHLRDDALARLVRDDRIDILIDLSGHTTHHRLPVFAMKPAPIQVTLLGYPNTTGLTAIDYRLTTGIAAPAGPLESLYTEKIIATPNYVAFRFPDDAPAVAPAPSSTRGYVTFGGFNRLSKISNETLAAWAAILRAVPDARLLVGDLPAGAVEEAFRRRFHEAGGDPARLDTVPPLPFADYLARHADVDLMLDSWPYSGGTTSNYAAWMGVPIVTLAGPGAPQRICATLLGSLGLDEWVAGSVAEYVEIATRAAANPAALGELRRGLRERVRTSPLHAPATVARGIELGLRRAWERWCAGLSSGRIDVSAGEIVAEWPEDLERRYHRTQLKGCDLAAS